MPDYISPIIEASELLAIYQTNNLILLNVSNGENALINHHLNHLEGALFIDLNTQLADIKDNLSNGGRHPLPNIKIFAERLSGLGITNESHVIIYDDKNGSNTAARLWWMLKSVGHKKVQVLNGGFQAAQKIGFPINSKIQIPTFTEPYFVDSWRLSISDIIEVEKASKDKKYLVIDVRDKKRYNGEEENIDLVAGHIPGAINVPFTSNLDENGFFLSSTELKEKYRNVFCERNPENIIVHCGSGVTACHTLLAIDYARLQIPKLYVGSWSEWSRNNKAIATEKRE